MEQHSQSGQKFPEFSCQSFDSAEEALDHRLQESVAVDPLKRERLAGRCSYQSQKRELCATVSLTKWVNRVQFSEKSGNLSQKFASGLIGK